MKRNVFLKGILPLLTVVLGFSSCLKDDNIQQDFTKLTPMVEIFAAKPSVDGAPNPLPVEFVSKPTPDTYNVEIRYASSQPSPGVTVTVAVDNAVLTKYNTVKGTDRFMVPAAGFSIPNNKVTIPAGSNSVLMPIIINSDKIDSDHEYAIPLKITDASGTPISGNFGTAVVVIGIKNKYDGNYDVTANKPMVDALSATISGFYPLNSDLITTGPNSVLMFCYTYLGGFEGHPIKSAGASSYYGNFAPIFTMDAAGNVVSVKNYYDGNPANTLLRSARLDPTGINKFVVSADGNTKVMDVSYIMTQGGSDRTFFHEKWTFVEPRE